MKIEIWSDVMCPFCYIGKRKFENALSRFAHKDRIEISWKSFQLDPSLKEEAGKPVHEFLAERKGITVERAREMNNQVSQIAAQAGLTFNLDKAVVANSFDAHRLSHLAKQHGVQNQMEEALFAAYFTEGKNTADFKTLLDLAVSVGLDKAETEQMLQSDRFADEVRQDIYEAGQIGVNGVPFFVLNDKYAVSGAQESSHFEGAINQAYSEWEVSSKV